MIQCLAGVSSIRTPVAPGESFEFDHTYSVKASDVGALVNTATATGHPPVGAAVTTKSTWTVQISPSASSSSLSGYVYLDKDNDGVKETSEAGLSGVKVTLIGKDLAGNTVSKSTTTDSTGYYKFASLPAGTYTITETQPTAYQDGKETQGTPGTGTVADNLFSNITLAAGVNGQNNNFGEVTKCSGYTTYTQGGWGCNPSGYNPGKFLADNFYSGLWLVGRLRDRDRQNGKIHQPQRDPEFALPARGHAVGSLAFVRGLQPGWRGGLRGTGPGPQAQLRFLECGKDQVGLRWLESRLGRQVRGLDGVPGPRSLPPGVGRQHRCAAFGLLCLRPQ